MLTFHKNKPFNTINYKTKKTMAKKIKMKYRLKNKFKKQNLLKKMGISCYFKKEDIKKSHDS